MPSDKILLACSSGGHLEQMLRLVPAFDDCELMLVTEDKPGTKGLAVSFEVYRIPAISRVMSFRGIGVIVVNLFGSIRCLLRMRPRLVISTGAGSCVPLLLIAKYIFRSKVIFIESFSKVKTPTAAGRFAYRFADAFIVQWPNLLRHYPKAKYFGGVY
jgi:UDP-N-acetylglucosamine:LPS N-acetylglucosamine transferase